MDWVTRNTFRNWLIAVLLASNLLTVSIIWMQTSKPDEAQPTGEKSRASESVQLMKKALDLSDEQARQVAQMHQARMEQSREYNDRMVLLKTQLAEDLFAGKPDTVQATLKAKEIGELQTQVELIRFQYFSDVLAISTPEQKERLKPILIELFGRKPPREEPDAKRPQSTGDQQQKPRNGDVREEPGEMSQDGRENGAEPPSADEKLARYSQRLNLTDEQVRAIRAVLLATQQQGEQLRTRVNPDRNELEREREKIRKVEDERIMNILRGDQKQEFERMILGRRK